ncbi:MAG: hypothetical protein EA398_03535 [Deltaproteobacteria bacterium]|nr:MAG: hypothetical protein EA398_03535 [Deltaproteobacteria bacterium]
MAEQRTFRLRRLLVAAGLVAGLSLAACGSDDGDGATDRPSGPVPTGGGSSDVPSSEPSTELPPADDTVIISYSREARIQAGTMPDEIQLVVVDTDCRVGDCPGGVRVVGGHDFSCANHQCELSTSGEFVLFRDPVTPSTLRVAALDESFQLTGPSTVLDEDVVRYVQRGDTVAWLSEQRAWSQRLGSGNTVDLGPQDGGDTAATSAGIQLSSDGSRVYLFAVGLVRMSIYEIPSGGGDIQLITRISAGTTSTSGSLFSGQEPFLAHEDDEFIYVGVAAIVLEEPCSSDAECGGQRFCSRDSAPARCADWSNTIARVSRGDSNLLGTSCGTDGQCGAGQRCDTSYINPNTQQGVCIPARYRVGGAGPNACAGWSEGQYNEMLPRFGRLADGRIAALVGTPCEDGNIDRSAVLAIGPGFSEADAVVTMSGSNHRGPECYDDASMTYNLEACAVQLSQLVVAENGSTLVAVGNSLDNRNSDQVWVFDAFGRMERYPIEVRLFDGERDSWRIRNLRTHPGL